MLKGTIVYTLNEERKYKYNVDATDGTLSFSGRLSSSSYEAMEHLEGEHKSTSPLVSRRFDVGSSRCKIEDNLGIDDKKVGVNTEFFAVLGSIIRYIKLHCQTSNEVGYTGLTMASDDFVAEIITKYSVPLGDFSRAHIVLELGYIKELSFEHRGYLVSLVDEYEQYPEPLYPFTVSSGCGLSFNTSHLGFDGTPKHVFNPDSDSSSLLYADLSEIIANNPEKSYDWLLNNKYEIVTDETLEAICAEIMNHKGFVYYDTETTGLIFNFKCEEGKGDKLVGLILSFKFGESYFFPIRMKNVKNLCGGDDIFFMEKYMRPILEGKDLVVHNLVFDWKVTYVYGINANIVHDTMLIFKLTFGAEKPDLSVSLKYLTKLFLKRDSIALHNTTKADKWGESDIDFSDLSPELTRLYACADTDNTMGLLEYAIRNNILQRYNQTKIYQIELGFSYAVAYQEYYGHLVDLTRLEELKKETTEGLEDCMERMVDIVGHKFNANSSTQLVKIMYTPKDQGGMGIPVQISRKTNKPTTDKATLKFLSELEDIEGRVKYPFVKILQEFRTHEGIRKIIDSYPDLITPDGYLFSEIDQFKSTGRISIKKPNYQSYNDVMKKYIVPRKGYIFTDQDYSSVEYRILGSMVGNQSIIDGFEDPEFDYHAYQASRMFSVPYESVTTALRKQAKGINFGLPYGMGDKSLGVSIYGEESDSNTKNAAMLRKRYFTGQEDIQRGFDKWREESVSNGYTSTFWGRRRYYDLSKVSKSSIKRQGGNQVIQGTAADCYKLAVGNLFKRLCKEGWLGKVLFTAFVHDELLSEVSIEISPSDWLRVSREEFQLKVEGWCPFYMGFGWGTNWCQAKKTEIPVGLQDKIITDFEGTGLIWNRDIVDFCTQIPILIDSYTKTVIKDYLEDSSHYGGLVKANIYKSIVDVLADDLGKKNLPVGLFNILDKYSEMYSISLPPNSFIEADMQAGALDNTLVDVVINYDDEDDEEVSAKEKQRVLDLRVETLGLYLDIPEKIVYLKVVPEVLLNLIKQKVNRAGEGYQVYFIDSAEKMVYSTPAYLSSSMVNEVQELYIAYFNQVKAMS